MGEEAFGRLQAERRASRRQRAHGDQAAISEDKPPPLEAYEFTIALKLVRRHSGVIRENAMQSLNAIELTSVVCVDIQRLALALLFHIPVEFLRDLLPLPQRSPHEPASQVGDRFRNELELATHIAVSDCIDQKTPIRTDDGARFQIHCQRLSHIVFHIRDCQAHALNLPPPFPHLLTIRFEDAETIAPYFQALCINVPDWRRPFRRLEGLPRRVLYDGLDRFTNPPNF